MGFSIMDILIPGQLNNKEYPSWAVKAADHFVEITKKKPMWEVIDLMVEVWMKKNPEAAKKHLEDVQYERKTRKNVYAATEKNGEVGTQRALGEIPTEIAMILDIFYYEQIEEMGVKKFYYKFFKKYPCFRVAEKL